MELKRKLRAASGVRDFCVCKNERILLVVTYDIIKIYDTEIQTPIKSIKLDMCPRIIKLAPNGNYFVVFQSASTISIYDTHTGTILQQIRDVPSSIKNIRFSNNSQKIIFASSQVLCLWNIRTCSFQVRTQAWKNINCYDLNEVGSQFAVGTYNGTFYIVNYLGNGRCTQIQLKRHSTCIVAMCFHKNKLISVSYDGFLLICTISQSLNGERTVAYNQMRVSSVPRQIQSIEDKFYMFDHKGVTWFTQNYVLVGLVDSKIYKILLNQQGQLIFVNLFAAQMEWWKLKSKN